MINSTNLLTQHKIKSQQVNKPVENYPLPPQLHTNNLIEIE